jgi:16S rRNA (adenine1518-N6/adenine1519-N6)-dimethyltransferase
VPGRTAAGAPDTLGGVTAADTPASAGPRLLGPADVRSLAAGLGLRPTKQRGQNFVIDPNTVRRIVRAADLSDDGETVLEVGPGLGSLTLALLADGHAVRAVEIDPVLAAALPGTIASYAPDQADRFSVLLADAMTVQATDLGTPSALVANLPYNVAVPVLLHLLQIGPSLRHGLVMVQAEVADRLAAPPGSKTYGVPSAKAAWYAEVRRAGPVGRNVFWPAPNVDSGLVSFVRRDPPPSSATREQVFAVVDAAFSQRRKTIRSALARWLPDRPRLDAVLSEAGIDPTARGEVLAIDSFARIATAAL